MNLNTIPLIWDDTENLGIDELSAGSLQNGSPSQAKPSVYSGPESPLPSNAIPAGAVSKQGGKDEVFAKETSYTIWVEVFENGSAVLDAYDKKQPNPKDICFFCETTDPKKSNLFGTFVLVKFGDEYRRLLFDLKEKKTQVASRRKNKLEATLIDSFEAEVKDNHSIISRMYGVNITREQVESAMDGELFATDGNLKKLNEIYDWYNDGIDSIAQKINGWMESAKFTDKDYQPSKQKPGVSPALESILDATISGLDYVIPDSVENFISDSFQTAFDSIKYLSSKVLPQSWIDFLEKTYNKVQSVLNFAKDIFLSIPDIIGEAFLLLRAVIMGFVNGLISTLQMLISLCAWILKTHANDSINGQMWRKINSYFEFIEDTYDLVAGKVTAFYDSVKVLIQDFSIEKLQSVFSVFAGKMQGYNRYDYAYFAGSFIFEVVLSVVLVFFTGGATAIAEAANLAEKAAAFLKLVAREAFSIVTGGIVDLFQLVSLFLKRFFEACKRGWEGLKSFFDEMLSTGKKEADDEGVPDLDDAIPSTGAIAEGAGAKNYRTKSRALDSMGAFKKLRKYENEIRNQKDEFARFFDDKGNELSASLTSGKANTVDIDPYDYMAFHREAKGNVVFTHNHPQSSSLSYHDIDIFVRYDFKEFRAITPENQVYALTRTGKLPSVDEFDNIIKPNVQAKLRSKNKKFFQIFDELSLKEKHLPIEKRSRTWKESNAKITEKYSDALLHELRNSLKYVKYK